MKLYTEKQLQARVGAAVQVVEDQLQARIDAAVTAAVAPLLARIAELEQQIARLQKNSSNSSKPPSSDIVKPPKVTVTRKKGKRRKGAQPGHPRHERTPFTQEEIDRQVTYEREDLDPKEWEPLDEWDVVQQIELKESPVEIVEHRARHYRHRRTLQVLCVPMPDEIKAAGLVGPRLSAYIAFLKGACHMSYTTIQTLLADVFGVQLSTGQLTKITTRKVSAALAEPYEQLRRALAEQPQLGIDETGHKDDGKRQWTWCFRARSFILFLIASSRGSEVLQQALGAAFSGVINCDYFSAYRKFMDDSSAIMQFCLAHLIRDVKFLAEQNDKVTRNWAERMLKDFEELFRLIHRREQLGERRFQARLERCRDKLVRQFKSAPDRPGVRDLRRRFKLHAKQFFTFVTTPGIEPTNNLTEQAIRYIVIDRKVTQGTRGHNGQRWSERIWTVLSTCRLQHRSAFQFLSDALRAFLSGDQAPSLLPQAP
jgi:transposase